MYKIIHITFKNEIVMCDILFTFYVERTCRYYTLGDESMSGRTQMSHDLIIALDE